MTVEPSADDRLPTAVTHLVTAFRQLGAEYQALTAERDETSARERRGTVTRMWEGIAQAANTVNECVTLLATIHGMRTLGITPQFAVDADGRDYSPLLRTADPGDSLHEAADCIEEVADTLSKVYAPTRKHPRLAVARHPQQMRAVFEEVHAALALVTDDLVAHGDEGAAEEFAPTLKRLDELKSRVCRTVPAQGRGLTADEVAAAIRADPEVARAAAAALAATD